MIEHLLSQQPDHKTYLGQKSALLTELANCHSDQGQFAEAKRYYEQGLEIDETLDDQRGQAVSLGQLGTLALQQRQYAEAFKYHDQARKLFEALGESAMVAVAYHQLGMVAEAQKDWPNAEQYYRQSLAIEESLRNNLGAALTCNQLAIVTESAGKPSEAEGWYQRALQTPDLPAFYQAGTLNNLADLLANQIQAGAWPPSRLTEAQGYAEQALAIKQTLDPAIAEIWTTFSILAKLADLAGQAAQAAEYRQQARMAYAAHAANRWHIDQQFGQFIAAIVAATQGNQEIRTAVAQALPQLEAKGWKISDAVQRIWAGERDWHSLCAEIKSLEITLFILRVLEELEANSEGNSQKAEKPVAKPKDKSQKDKG